MLKLHAIQGHFEYLKLVAITDCNGFKPLDLHAELIDDSPSDDLLTRDPDSGFFVISLSKEEFQVEQVPEAATLEDLDLNAR